MRTAVICLGLVAVSGVGRSHAQSAVSGHGPAEAWIGLGSDPPGAEVRIADRVLRTPHEILLLSGHYALEATLDGFLPLPHEVELAPADSVGIEFIMLRAMPDRPSAEDLGLAFQIDTPPRTLAEAERITDASRTMMEIFAVAPLALGLAFKVGESHASGDAMILSGLALIAASYFLGDLLHDRKVEEIETYNDEISVLNAAARSHNSAVEDAVETRYSEDLTLWEEEAERRGRVSITRR
ncbi:MAG: hypothetical protein ACYTCU_09975 [Planctomycetota bacterium]